MTDHLKKKITEEMEDKDTLSNSINFVNSSNAKTLEENHKNVIEKIDDGFEDLMLQLQDKIETYKNKLDGGNDELRKPKKPVRSFLRFHMEEFNLIKAKKPQWTPNQISLNIKQHWDALSDEGKKRYISAYDRDMQKYEKIVQEFEKLTQKPKKPTTPYFQFFSDNLQVYRKNYPQLSQNEVTSIIAKDWSNFDSKKKRQMHDDYERQKTLYKKQIKSYDSKKENSYIDYSEYLSRLEDYERECEEELEALRKKHPKPPTVAEIKKEQQKLQQPGLKDTNLQSFPQKKEEKLSDKQIKKIEEAIKETVVLKEVVGAIKEEQNKGKKPVKASNEINAIQSELKKSKPLNIEADIKEARSSNRQSLRTRRPESNLREHEPAIQKKQKTSNQSATETRSQLRQRSRENLQKSDPEVKKVGLLRTRSQSKQISKPRTTSSSQPKQQVQTQRSTQSSSISKGKVRYSSRLRLKQIRKLQKEDVNDSKRNIKILQRRSKTPIALKKESESGDQTLPDDIEEVNLNSGSVRIKHMLGMRNGDEREYLVLFKNGTQRWTKEDDPIFKEKRNVMQLQIFLQQIKGNQRGDRQQRKKTSKYPQK